MAAYTSVMWGDTGRNGLAMGAGGRPATVPLATGHWSAKRALCRDLAIFSRRSISEECLQTTAIGISPRLQRSLATTNAAESLISRTRHVKRNVKRWRGGQMMLRWVAAGVLEAAKGFRRLKGRADMPQLIAALRARGSITVPTYRYLATAPRSAVAPAL